ncbi:hypothetical protein Q1695_013496 [Nippostrongylus brasiliensis]|nr:hypothetical protein Q1695_013496 [Nippostrongylus brasiliensis]
MKDVDYEIVDNIAPDDAIWEEWKQTMFDEGWWSAADDSTLAMRAKLTKNVTALKKEDGSFIGSLVWSESNGLVYIAYYILRKEYRGLGIGSLIWKRAFELIPSTYTLALRAVDSMLSRYKAKDFPVEGQHVVTKRIRVADLIEIVKPRVQSKFNSKPVSELSMKEFEAALSYANEVTGQDRSHLLRAVFDMDFVKGAALTDETSKMRGLAAITTAGPREGRLYKISPLYADGLDEALSVLYPLLVETQKEEPDAVISVSTWNESAGEQLRALIEEKCISSITVYTLFSRPYSNPINFSRMFIAQNNACQFDA